MVAIAGSTELGELAQYAAAVVAVAVASGWLTVRVLRRRSSCSGACTGCDRADLGTGECSRDAKPESVAPSSGGIRSPELQVFQEKR